MNLCQQLFNVSAETKNDAPSLGRNQCLPMAGPEIRTDTVEIRLQRNGWRAHRAQTSIPRLVQTTTNNLSANVERWTLNLESYQSSLCGRIPIFLSWQADRPRSARKARFACQPAPLRPASLLEGCAPQTPRSRTQTQCFVLPSKCRYSAIVHLSKSTSLYTICSCDVLFVRMKK